MTTKGPEPGYGKYPAAFPKTMVTHEMETAMLGLMEKHGMSKSDAIRHILDNGLIYMAIYGDGVGNEM